MPDQILKELSNLFLSKNKEYGNAWIRQGDVLNALYPNGISLSCPNDHLHYHLMVQMVVKLNRLAADKNHLDSAKDMAVFSAMLASTIEETSDENKI